MRAAVDPRDEQRVGNREVRDQPRRDRAAAGLDPPGPVEQQHRAAAPREIGRRGRPGRTAADHDDIEGRHHCHRLTPPAAQARRRRQPSAPRCDPCAAADARREHGRDEEQHGLAGEHRRIGERRRAEQMAREIGRAPCRASRRARRRSPAPRPTGPCACLRATRGRRRRGPSSSRWRRRRRRRWRRRARTPTRAAARPGRRAPASASAAERHAPRRGSRRSSRRAASRTAAAEAARDDARRGSCPTSTPPCWTPASLRRFARREAEDRAGERLEDQVLRAVGEHRRRRRRW